MGSWGDMDVETDSWSPEVCRAPGNTKHKVSDSDLTSILVITAGLRESQEAEARQT